MARDRRDGSRRSESTHVVFDAVIWRRASQWSPTTRRSTGPWPSMRRLDADSVTDESRPAQTPRRRDHARRRDGVGEASAPAQRTRSTHARAVHTTVHSARRPASAAWPRRRPPRPTLVTAPARRRLVHEGDTDMRTRSIVALASALLCVSAIAGTRARDRPDRGDEHHLRHRPYRRDPCEDPQPQMPGADRYQARPVRCLRAWRTAIVPRRELRLAVAPRGRPRHRSSPEPSPCYRGDDPTCTPQVVPAGSGFVRPTAAMSTSCGTRAASTPWCT